MGRMALAAAAAILSAAASAQDCDLCGSSNRHDPDKYACSDPRADPCSRGWTCSEPWTDMGGGALRCYGSARTKSTHCPGIAPESCGQPLTQGIGSLNLNGLHKCRVSGSSKSCMNRRAGIGSCIRNMMP